MEYRWNILNPDLQKAATLQEALRISPTLCRILSLRGISDFEDARNFFRPSLQSLHDPFLMKDMDKAVKRISKAIGSEEKILVFGDYDVDGTTSVASMYMFLASLAGKERVDYYIPHRYREGYGISKAGIDFANENGYTLMVALDCGIKSVELISYASSLSIDFIVCDHHLPGKELPAAAAILNPKQNGCPYPYKELCGCGVGFKLMMALASHFRLPDSSYLEYLDLLAVAIAADIVPITGENRIFVFHGLNKINSNPSLGIRNIISLSGINGPFTNKMVVFTIAPRINAAGRMDDARKAVQLFVESDANEALELAKSLQSDNTERKETDSQITQEALDMIRTDPAMTRRKSTVVFNENWHKGVVGIVASRLTEHYYRPTVVLTKSEGLITGSARSIRDFNLYEAIYECREYLMAFGGHFAAAGLSMLPENFEKFSEKFEQTVAASVTEEMLIPQTLIDAEISLDEITPQFFQILSQMEPFGPENMNPVFLARNVTNTGYSKIVKEKHLRFSVRQNNATISGIGFGLAHKADVVLGNRPFDVVFTLEDNFFNDQHQLQLKVIDCNPSA